MSWRKEQKYPEKKNVGTARAGRGGEEGIHLPPHAPAHLGVGTEAKNKFGLCESGRESTSRAVPHLLLHASRGGVRAGAPGWRGLVGSSPMVGWGWCLVPTKAMPGVPRELFFFFFQAGACKHQGAGAALGGVRRVEQDVKAVSALWVVLGKSLQCRQAPGSDRGSSARLLAEGSAPRVEI